jgi:hypothetical protein
MTIYVDPLMGHGLKLHGHTEHNCHLFCDTDVDKLPSFKESWAHSRRCIIPVEGVYEPCYETGQAARWLIL